MRRGAKYKTQVRLTLRMRFYLMFFNLETPLYRVHLAPMSDLRRVMLAAPEDPCGVKPVYCR